MYVVGCVRCLTCLNSRDSCRSWWRAHRLKSTLTSSTEWPRFRSVSVTTVPLTWTLRCGSLSFTLRRCTSSAKRTVSLLHYSTRLTGISSYYWFMRSFLSFKVLWLPLPASKRSSFVVLRLFCFITFQVLKALSLVYLNMLPNVQPSADRLLNRICMSAVL